MKVVWWPDALDRLAAAYDQLTLAQQSQLAGAVVRAARELAARPHELGESRGPAGSASCCASEPSRP